MLVINENIGNLSRAIKKSIKNGNSIVEKHNIWNIG